MRFLMGKELEDSVNYMQTAAIEAAKSTCVKSQRGVVIVKYGKVIGCGYNKVSDEEFCNPCMREHISDNSRVEECSAVHAEEVAILDTHKRGIHNNKGAVLYQIKTKKGKLKPSDAPSCTTCSRSILEAELEGVVLWHKQEYVLKQIPNVETLVMRSIGNESGCFAFYDSKEYNHISLMYFKKRNELKELTDSGRL